MSNIPFHPAPGLGDLLPGFFVVPQNPITGRAAPTAYIPGVGDIMPGSFPVPQNPVKDYAMGQTKMIGQQSGTGYGVHGIGSGTPDTINSSMAGLSGACGCGGGCNSCSCGKLNGLPVGMGDLSSDWTTLQYDATNGNIMQLLKDTVFGVPVWAIGAGLALFMFVGGKESHYRRGRRALAAY